jgi:hypothetical protein
MAAVAAVALEVSVAEVDLAATEVVVEAAGSAWAAVGVLATDLDDSIRPIHHFVWVQSRLRHRRRRYPMAIGLVQWH